MDDIVAAVPDLFFRSRISSAARSAGRTVRFIAPGAATDGYRLALVDLDAGDDVLDDIQRLKEACSAPLVAFGPHVDTEGRKAARAAGADRVLAKSRFVTELPALMRSDGLPVSS
ncbi:MAG TPA: DNA-binding response regulator [Chloroflexota bacterium]